jgi:hypothetical protein
MADEQDKADDQREPRITGEDLPRPAEEVTAEEAKGVAGGGIITADPLSARKAGKDQQDF